MRNYFILNGRDSRDFGVYISGQGTFSAPQKAYTFYNVPGRNGAILGNENRLENINVSYEAFIYADFDNSIAKFRTYLLSLNGYVKLTDSYHPDEYRYAVYTGPFEPKVTKINDAGSFTITFSCKPQRYLTSGDTSYYWVPGGSQEISGSELNVYGSKLDTSKLNWSYEDHGIVVSRRGNHYYNFLCANTLAVKIDGNTVASYSIPDVTKGSANLITGSLTINASVVTTPATGWTLYDTKTFRVSVFGWSKLNAARRKAVVTPISPGVYGDVGEYPVYATVSELADVNYGACLYNSYLYVKENTCSTAQEFMENFGGFSVDRTLSTAQSQSFTPFVPDYPNDFMTLSGVNGSAETFTMKYTASDSMSNPTEFPSSPLIRAYGNGSFVMDGVTITITNATSYTDIDCDLMDCYEGTTNRNNDVSFSTYDFPKLRPGDNAVSIVSGITALEITPRWWRV